MNVRKFHIDGLNGSTDITSIRNTLQAMNGVHSIRVDNVSNTLTIEFDDTVSENEIRNTINTHKNLQ